MVGFDDALNLNLTGKQSRIRYLVDSAALVFWAKIRNGISQTNITTCANTDNRLGRNLVFKENLNHQIALSEWGGGGAPKDFLGYMEMLPDGATTHNIQQLNGIMGRKPIDRKRGPIDARILKLLA